MKDTGAARNLPNPGQWGGLEVKKKKEVTLRMPMKAKNLVLFTLLVCLVGCYAGSVKPLLNRPEFKAENQPIRTLRVLLINDNTYRKEEIEKFVSRCSSLVEKQVGIRLEIVDWHPIKWEDELDDIIKTEMRVAGDTWSKRDKFDITLTFVHFVYNIAGGKLPLGATDTFFWRYIFVGELDPYILLHELFHAFLMDRSHSEEWVMKSGRPAFGNEWYWLTPADRKAVLRNKWRDFNVMPATGGEGQRKSKESWFYARVYEARGVVHSRREQYGQAISDFSRAIEIDPGFAEAYFSRGRAYCVGREYDKSWEDIKKAQDLGYEIPPEFLEDLRKVSGREK